MLQVQLMSDGDIRVWDTAEIDITTDQPVSADTWYFLEFYFQHSDSAAWEVFLNGNSILNGTGADFSRGGTFDTIDFRGQSSANVDYDDIYFGSGATAASDRLGSGEVYAYLSTLASATGDWGTNPVLQTGNWNDAQEVPFGETNVAAFTDITARRGGVDTNDAGGSEGTGGPNTDTNIDGDSNIVAMKGIWRMKRAGGSGAVHYGILGNTGSAIADSDRTADFDPSTSYANYFDVREDNLPLSTEYGRIGFEKDNKGQDFDCADMLFQILHVPDAAVAAFKH
jgi:hypothetical protein